MINDTDTRNSATPCSKIERVVMRRVRIIRAGRILLSNTVMAALLAVCALWGIGKSVWVARVFENAPTTGYLTHSVQFYISAFTHTEFLVQALSLCVFFALILLAREVARKFISIIPQIAQ